MEESIFVAGRIYEDIMTKWEEISAPVEIITRRCIDDSINIQTIIRILNKKFEKYGDISFDLVPAPKNYGPIPLTILNITVGFY